MRSQVEAAMTHHAAARLFRRRSLLTLGGTGLAAAKPFGKKKARNECRRQAGQCDGFFTNVCGSEAGRPETFACCELLANCTSGAFVACLGDLET